MCVVGDVRAMLLTILWLFFDIIDIFDVYWNVCTNLSSEITKHTLFIIILEKIGPNWRRCLFPIYLPFDPTLLLLFSNPVS